MTDILYKDGTPVPDPNRPGKNLSYSIDKRMQRYLDQIKNKITKKDKDWVILVDGYEGAGKSTAAQQWGKYVDPTLNIDRVCMTADEFKQAIIRADKAQCVIYDEAVTGMSSGDSVTRVGKLLRSMMMQMRQKNLFVIVILPTVFELNTYAVLSRAKGLFHIYESGGRMGYFVGYNRKDTRLLYLKGKKTRSYKVRSYFRGRFYGKYSINEEKYRKKKEDALFMIDEPEKNLGFMEKTHIGQRDKAIFHLITDEKVPQVKVAQLFGLKAQAVSKIYHKWLEMLEKQGKVASLIAPNSINKSDRGEGTPTPLKEEENIIKASI